MMRWYGEKNADFHRGIGIQDGKLFGVTVLAMVTADAATAAAFACPYGSLRSSGAPILLQLQRHMTPRSHYGRRCGR